MKSKIIAGALMLVMCSLGMNTQSNAKTVKIKKVVAPVPSRKIVKVRTLPAKVVVYKGNKRPMKKNIGMAYNMQRKMVWVPGHWEKDRYNKRMWKTGYYRKG